MPVVHVALPVPLARTFDYLLPQGLQPAVGARVGVPWGKQRAIGIVTGCSETSELPLDKLKPIDSVIDDASLFSSSLWRILRWASDYYHYPIGEVLFHALPILLRQGKAAETAPLWQWFATEQGRATPPESLKRAPKQQQALAALLQRPVYRHQVNELALTESALQALRTKGLVDLRAQTVATQDWRPGFEVLGERLRLNTEQATAVGAIRSEDTQFAAWLLAGVTGSGKTEVYLSVLENILAAGKQALVLVPEIGLTPQTLARFRGRLGIAVHALHSGLNDNARARVWAAASRGEARVIVGTRSAVFTPLPQAGLLIIDEEHDGSYKQQDGIRYHARDFALVRAKALGIPVLLGSATPSLETLHNAYAGRYTHLRLKQRAGDARPPRVRILDVRKRPLHDGLSADVLAGIGEHLQRGQQVLVFKNRRGYAPVLLCHDCGWTAPCNRCDAPMTVHGGGRRLQCHHCGARQPAPLACPACGSLALQPQGIGTERLEEHLTAAFADVPVVRIDRGTTSRRNALEQQLAKLGDQPGILVGTQILAKGHDLPKLTLVVVVGIDEGLFSADFRASEKLAQQLIQVAGRAGRARDPGEVWLQTHHPGHPLLETLVSGGYHPFAQAELNQRQAAGFPPFAHLALMRAEAQQVEHANAFLLAARQLLGEQNVVEAYGPMPAPMPRRAGYQRTQLLLSAVQRPPLHGVLGQLVPQLYALPEARKVRWSLDVDPTDLY